MTDAGTSPGQPPEPPPDIITDEAAELAVELSEAGRSEERRQLSASFARTVRRGARATSRRMRAAGVGASAASGWLSAQAIAMAPRLRIRDQAALHAQFPGLAADELAEILIERAARAAAAVGGTVGAWAALPFLPAIPAEVAAETLAVVGIEVKLIAELHEAYGMPATGGAATRAGAYLAAWAHRRGVFMVPGGVVLAAGSPLMRRLRRRLAARAGRSAVSLGPLLTGAAAGALLNRRETHRLGQQVHADLRGRAQRAIETDPHR